jgi:hypothetical protein
MIIVRYLNSSKISYNSKVPRNFFTFQVKSLIIIEMIIVRYLNSSKHRDKILPTQGQNPANTRTKSCQHRDKLVGSAMI